MIPLCVCLSAASHEQQIGTVADLKLLAREDLREMGFSVGAGNRLLSWVRSMDKDKEKK
jgi:hypothetical protein